MATFDPEGSGYDYKSARAAGVKPDKTGHWQSRLPSTGLLLKGKKHKTWYLTVQGEKEAGHKIYKGTGGRYYSQPMTLEEKTKQRLEKVFGEKKYTELKKLAKKVPRVTAQAKPIKPKKGSASRMVIAEKHGYKKYLKAVKGAKQKATPEEFMDAGIYKHWTKTPEIVGSK